MRAFSALSVCFLFLLPLCGVKLAARPSGCEACVGFRRCALLAVGVFCFFFFAFAFQAKDNHEEDKHDSDLNFGDTLKVVMKNDGKTHTYDVKVDMEDKVSNFYEKVAEAVSLELGTFRILVGGKDLMGNKTDAYGHRPLTDYEGEINFHKRLNILLKMKGGAGKRSRMEDNIVVRITADPDDPEAVREAAKMERFNIAAWLETMSVSDLEKLLAAYEGTVISHANQDWHVTRLCDYVPIFTDLQEPTLKTLLIHPLIIHHNPVDNP